MNQSVHPELAQQQQALLFLLDYLKQHRYQFSVITPLSHQRIVNRKLRAMQTAVSFQDIFGWNLPFYAADFPPELFHILQAAQLIRPQQQQWVSTVRVASLGEELFIHSAFPTVEQDAVFFGPDTYRFNYYLTQYLNQQPLSPHRIVEICCGSSAAAITLARKFPDIREIYATDINPKALFYSDINAKSAGVNHIQFLYSDLFNQLQGEFDLIFTNPPYLIDPQERQYRHGGNQLDGTDLAFNIIKQGIHRLTPHGSLFLYTGVAIHEQGNKFLHALKQLMNQYSDFHYNYSEIDSDVFGEELDQPGYEQIERIALALVKIKCLVQ